MGYEIYGKVASRAFRALWALEEVGATYVQHAESPRSEAMRRLHPSGKVPVLVTDGVAIPDSSAIVQFLADRHATMTAPPGSLERARQDAMTFRILDEVDSLLWTAARHSFVLPEERRVPEIKATLRWEWERAGRAIADDLAGDWLMGETFTVPDIILGHCLGWAIVAKFGLPDPRLDRYLDRVKARPAYAAARERNA